MRSYRFPMLSLLFLLVLAAADVAHAGEIGVEDPVPLVHEQNGPGLVFLAQQFRERVGDTSGTATYGSEGQGSEAEEETTVPAPGTSQGTTVMSDTTYTSKPIGQADPPTTMTETPTSGNDQDSEQSWDESTEMSGNDPELETAGSMQQSTIPLARSAPSIEGPTQQQLLADTGSGSQGNGGDESESHNSEKIIDVTLDFVPEISGCTDVVEVASEIPNLTTLVRIMKVAGVVENVAGRNKVMTILAPTNGAFGATLKAIGITLDQLLANPTLLKRVLALHIIPGQALKSKDLSDGQKLKTLSGEEITFSIDPEIDTMSVTVPSGVTSEVILKNVEACSAVVHVIGTMLLPEVKKGTQSAEAGQGNNDQGGEGNNKADGEGGEQTGSSSASQDGQQGSSTLPEAVTAQSQESPEG